MFEEIGVGRDGWRVYVVRYIVYKYEYPYCCERERDAKV